ncbi:alpha/beta fold hydrolase [Streptomyces sioyaensis]|uniref:alpha/beta hydrolase n=1 Tax=Streptomyces sioyaensis TaxID=67364 RepID=UPI00341056D0
MNALPSPSSSPSRKVRRKTERRPLFWAKGAARKGSAVAAAALLFAGSSSAPAFSEGKSTDALCSDVSVSATLPDVGSQTIRGTLCTPKSETHTLQILLSGVTYDRNYWTLRSAPGKSSYAEAATKSGYATLALDRIGTGSSGHPPAEKVGLKANVDTLHQVVKAVRAGNVGGQSYSRVITVGHSFGASVAVAEAEQEKDVDGVIASAFLHALGPRIGEFDKSLYQATQDPVTSHSNPPKNYLTTQPGTRSDLFYSKADAAPETQKADEFTKSTETSAEGHDIAVVQSSPKITRGVNVPVLLAVGEGDELLCGGKLKCDSATHVQDFEKGYYSDAAKLTTFVLPHSGHAINLHRNSELWFRAASDWVSRNVGQKT